MASSLPLLFFWALYCAVHSLTAALWFKKWARSWMGRGYRFYRIGYNLISTWTAVALFKYQYRLPADWLFEPVLATRLAGGTLIAAGLLTIVLALRSYSGEFFGADALRGKQPSEHLVETGILGRVRHPLYLGLLLVLWGQVVFDPRAVHLHVNLLLTAYTLLGIWLEERKLVIQFGEAYRRYRQRVPMLLPKWGGSES